ncbi:NUDIX hydrolase [Streptomyces sp. ISL-98]|uniref:NUDIX domain-containing protein n=1 Tax=Streptomyces sp. ISL-98 TaxID=2819192 RepID=UPI001BE7169A|nr:NUDIX hydrolase [Streptomyces sp. ISL-98]MBT2509066.1 NUDIX hydrolase [Streptomyces sp. ISL-98]
MPDVIPAGIPVTARMLIAARPAYRVAFVHTIGRRPAWILPGGLVEPGESPRAATEREVRQELGLDLTAGPLLAVEWIQARTPGRRGRLNFVFAGPRLTADDVDRIVLQETEVDGIEWADHTRAKELVHSRIAARVGVPPGLPGPTDYIHRTPETP